MLKLREHGTCVAPQHICHGNNELRAYNNIILFCVLSEEDPNMPSNEEYFLDDLEQEQTGIILS